MRHHSEFITLVESSETRSSHFRTGTDGPWHCAQTREHQVETNMLCGRLIEKEKEFPLNIKKIQKALKCELIKLLEEKKLLYQHYLMRNTILSKLSEPKDYSLIEARSELDMQELRVQCSDRGLRESRTQLHSQRMELSQTNELPNRSPRKKDLAFHRKRVFQQDRMKESSRNGRIEEVMMHRS